MVIAWQRGRTRRAPWPAHCQLQGIDLPLALMSKNGDRLVAVVPPNQPNVTPTAYGEFAKNPAFGAPYPLRDLTRGMGQRHARTGPNGRYWYTLNARVRAGRWIQGPELTSSTPGTRDSTIGITRWFEIGAHIYAVNGRYCLDGSTDGTGWTVSKDFGSGKAATDAIVVQTNQASSTKLAFVAMGDAEKFWSFDGTTWTQHASLYARAWALDPLTFFRATDVNQLTTCDLDANPLTAGNWASATDRFGGYDLGITRMEVNAAGALIVYKAEDIFSLQPDGATTRLFGRQQFPSASTNGEALGAWRNDSYVVYGNALFRLTPDGGLTQVGPELMKDNGSPVRGYVTAMAGTDFYMLAGIYEPDAGSSYVIEYTGELVADEEGRAEPTWHGSITPAFASKKITSIYVSTIGASSLHKCVYIGFSNGTISKYLLSCTPDPSDCTAERFSTAAGSVYGSRAYFGFPSERKALLNATGEGDNFSSTDYATLSYKTSNAGAYIALTTAFNAGERRTVAFPDSTSCIFLDPLVTLTNSASTISPQVSGVSILFQTRPVPQEILQIAIPCEDGLRKRDGTPYRLGKTEISAYIQLLAGFAGGVEFIEPDGDTHQVLVGAPQRVVAWDMVTKQTREAVQVMLVEQQPNETSGILANLELYTLAQLNAFLLSQLNQL